MRPESNALAAGIAGFSKPFSSITHLLGAGVFLTLGIVFLIGNRRVAARTAAVSVFVITMHWMFIRHVARKITACAARLPASTVPTLSTDTLCP
jgi:hypothetical protein